LFWYWQLKIFNKYVEEVSARPEAVKQVAERLLNDGDAPTYLAIALRRPAPEPHERSLYIIYIPQVLRLQRSYKTAQT
jgi:hypothetical protein